MSKKLYVGNLSYSTTEESLASVFEAYGPVLSTTIIKDRETGNSKGFGFVELEDEGQAQRAIESLSGREVDGRRIRVNEAQEKRPRSDAPRSGYRRQSGSGEGRW